MGRLDRDERESKFCYDHRYGRKFKSYRLGFIAGKRDGKRKDLEAMAKCPFVIPEEVWKLLQKRARWFSGYDNGWEVGRRRKKKLMAKKKKRRDG